MGLSHETRLCLHGELDLIEDSHALSTSVYPVGSPGSPALIAGHFTEEEKWSSEVLTGCPGVTQLARARVKEVRFPVFHTPTLEPHGIKWDEH